jgi:hypothetical protein
MHSVERRTAWSITVLMTLLCAEWVRTSSGGSHASRGPLVPSTVRMRETQQKELPKRVALFDLREVRSESLPCAVPGRALQGQLQ